MKPTNKAVFLDRDGVLNEEIGTYVWEPEKFIICPGVPESLTRLKAAGYRLIVVTNQAGIAKKLYTAAEVQACHAKLQAACGGIIDALYFADAHPSVSESILRKPDSGMLEKAIARFDLDVAQCWIVGDRLRDMEAGAKVDVRGILVGHQTGPVEFAPYVQNLQAATDVILAEAEAPLLLAWRMYPEPNGTGYHAEDLDTEEKVQHLFDYCQVLEASILDEGWQFLLQHYGIERLYQINKKSGWHDADDVKEYQSFLPNHLFSELE
ncbi:hypothetical protein GCM10023185_34340 [Hymenobacter saemangeumensis]|uniref:D,D-heptose 1,7-bisphosphate phosphatase n=1 Tax=Hymenobacter saemangeumensis TaxID=1084522 RepID=A0ABP8INW2_9BACT